MITLDRFGRAWRRIGGRETAPIAPMTFHVLLPTKGPPNLGGARTPQIEARPQLAASAAQGPVTVLAVDARARRLWCAQTGRARSFTFLTREGVSVLTAPAFFLADRPPVAALVDAAARDCVSWCGTGST